MPRRDGTGPLGNGTIGRGRGGCQQGFGGGFGQGMRCGSGNGFGFANTTNTLEAKADYLEAQATNLRNIAKQNRTAE